MSCKRSVSIDHTHPARFVVCTHACGALSKLTMRPSVAALFILSTAASTTYIPQHQSPLALPDIATEVSDFVIPSVHESAVLARRILHLSSIGTLSTTFPSDADSRATLESRPHGLGGVPIGLMDYFADCEPSTGNPTILALDIATSFKNVAAGSNISLELRWQPPNVRTHSAAAMPRFSLLGRLEHLREEEIEEQDVAGCFVEYHPDAVAWLPGNMIHVSRWTRLVVEDIYWIGGFGDRAYIGWIAAENWRNVTMKEIDAARLPGEGTESAHILY